MTVTYEVHVPGESRARALIDDDLVRATRLAMGVCDSEARRVNVLDLHTGEIVWTAEVEEDRPACYLVGEDAWDGMSAGNLAALICDETRRIDASHERIREMVAVLGRKP